MKSCNEDCFNCPYDDCVKTENRTEYHRQYYKKNREKLIENQKRYYQKNKEKVAQYHKEYYRKKKENESKGK